MPKENKSRHTRKKKKTRHEKKTSNRALYSHREIYTARSSQVFQYNFFWWKNNRSSKTLFGLCFYNYFFVSFTLLLSKFILLCCIHAYPFHGDFLTNVTFARVYVTVRAVRVYTPYILDSNKNNRVLNVCSCEGRWEIETNNNNNNNKEHEAAAAEEEEDIKFLCLQKFEEHNNRKLILLDIVTVYGDHIECRKRNWTLFGSFRSDFTNTHTHAHKRKTTRQKTVS